MRPARATREERNRLLAADFRRGRRPALARAISMVEGGRPGVADLLRELLLVRPRARRIGITGPPGAGKSSLAAHLATRLRGRGEEVAIVAVDPTSPFTGGALLGDRIRMNDLATDPGIFIRSMATRGSLGGLAATTREVIDLLDAFGFPNIMIETVGVGQTQLEIQAAADTTAVVLVPESGDGVQAMKAGLMEIADVFVVNKSDRVGADRLVREIRQALLLRAGLASRDVSGHHGVDLARVADAAGPHPADSDAADAHPADPVAIESAGVPAPDNLGPRRMQCVQPGPIPSVGQHVQPDRQFRRRETRPLLQAVGQVRGIHGASGARALSKQHRYCRGNHRCDGHGVQAVLDPPPHWVVRESQGCT